MNKWFALSLGTIVGLSHIGMIGMIAQRSGSKFPALNLPVGDYTSYNVEAGEDGYRINYQANDPKVMMRVRDGSKPSGFLGFGRTKTSSTEQYTMDGAEHHGGPVSTHKTWIDPAAVGTEGKKLSEKTVACIEAAGGGRSTGKIVGGSVGAVAGTTLSSIPFVGWVLAGAATMMGMDAGGEIGGEMAKSFADCDPEDLE